MSETFGQRVRRDRLALNWNIYDLAAAARVGAPHVSKVENDRDQASDELVVRLAKVLGQDPDEYLLVARRLPQWVADMFADHPAAWIKLLRQRHRITPESLGGDLRDARKVHCPTCDALPGDGCKNEAGHALRGWHRTRRQAASGEPRTRIDELLDASSLGAREVQDVSAGTPDWVVDEVLRRARSACAACSHPQSWHQHGPAEWGECDADGCECEMYDEPTGGGDV